MLASDAPSVVRPTRVFRPCLAMVVLAMVVLALAAPANAQSPPPAEVLIYHPIRVDGKGKIVPWPGDDLGRAYDQVIRLVWSFWDRMPADRNGLPYHMNHQVWNERLDDHRGLGGDQIQMALSSWGLLYQYMGEAADAFHGQRRDRIVENMRFMADWYLAHSLSPPASKWPNLPYPYNTLIYSGVYDGDMILGKGFTQPDKAGSLGIELVNLWKMVDIPRYLQAAIAIADTLAARTRPGDAESSPLPFKVNAETGAVGILKDGKRGDQKSSYTTNWTGTLQLFEALAELEGREVSQRQAAAYRRASRLIVDWMKKFPLRTNRWGPFFEDIPGWSDTQINAATFASYMMDHPALFPAWKTGVRGILDWVYQELGNREWERYGVVAVNEQTAYRVPGNSHTARQAAAELRYAELTGETRMKENAIRQLSWATYMVDKDGRNLYPRDDIWMTDGYGDYVRHYLRAMAAAPELAPQDQDHILRCSTIVARVQYRPDRLSYSTWRPGSVELVRVLAKPRKVTLGKSGAVELRELEDLSAGEGWTWQPLEKGGLLRVRHDSDKGVTVHVR